ncbi:Siroheme synthase / Precorrin-2 oxidase / Sirohydrochlorin ferrochelatase / Uroporphyrinogen-III methyltransferase [hydrothermal vent metagenome]|uniref:precorrin-2 dehydrogenase n=1 Tax=hydrothermal vent metagenome TaxID=652676 RepID=A0A3B1C689_9ZZZZ
MSPLYPLFLDINGKPCLIVGGGAVAFRKAMALLKCGAKVSVVAPELTEKMKELVDSKKITYIPGFFKPEHMEGVTLAFGCTDMPEVNRAVYVVAVARGVLVNIVDQPKLCSFMVPAVVRRGDLSLAISTSGKSPAVAKKARKSLEKEFGEEWAVYLDMMGKARETVLKTIDDQARRETIFNNLTDSDLLDKIKNGDMAGAKRLVEEITEA